MPSAGNSSSGRRGAGCGARALRPPGADPTGLSPWRPVRPSAGACALCFNPRLFQGAGSLALQSPPRVRVLEESGHVPRESLSLGISGGWMVALAPRALPRAAMSWLHPHPSLRGRGRGDGSAVTPAPALPKDALTQPRGPDTPFRLGTPFLRPLFCPPPPSPVSVGPVQQPGPQPRGTWPDTQALGGGVMDGGGTDMGGGGAL